MPFIPAFSQDLKSGRPKCALEPVQMGNLYGNIRKIKRFSVISGCPQDTWTPNWLIKACFHTQGGTGRGCLSQNLNKLLTPKGDQWVIPENIHTIPRVASWNSEGEGGFLDWNSEDMGSVTQFGISKAWGGV